MEGAIVGRCTHQGTTISIPIFYHTTFSEVYNEVCSRLSNLTHGLFDLTYALPGYSTCLLQSNMDVRMLYMSVVNEKYYCVDIVINQKSCRDNDCVSRNTPASQTFIIEGNIHSDGNEYLGKYATPGGKVYMSNSWKTYINHVNQGFEGGVEEFRGKLCKYAVDMGFTFVYVKNDRERVTAVCNKKYSEGCQWRVHASVCHVNNFFYIKRLNNEHTCTGHIREKKSGMMSSKILASTIVEKIRTRPRIKPIDIVMDFKRDYGLDISYYNAWYGKEIAKIKVHGDDSLSYHQMVWYVEAVKKTNPGSHCELEFDQETFHFQRIFIAFGGSIEGFKFCRPMLFLDGTFLKDKYKGTLLAAIGKNGNQGFFPLAFALVDGEDQNNWTWFLKNLAKILEPQQRTITFIYDRHKGLIPAVTHTFPDSPHAYCLHHIKLNILEKYHASLGSVFRNKIVQKFSECAYAATPEMYELKMAALVKEGGHIMRKFFKDLPKENFCNAFFKGKRYREMWSNVAESFNAWISNERLLPIYQLVDGIRIKLMEMNAERHLEANKWTTFLCPEMEVDMVASIEVGRHWLVRRSSECVFEVQTDDTSLMVDLESQICSCQQWQIKGFPFSHALAAILKNGANPFYYTEAYFSTDYYKSSYSFPIQPIPQIDKPHMSEDTEFIVKPPKTRKQPGRPRIKRIKSAGEEARPLECGRCHQVGHHNQRTCSVLI
ncbi:unnamed protein product [Malus baccata var. baccata]